MGIDVIVKCAEARRLIAKFSNPQEGFFQCFGEPRLRGFVGNLILDKNVGCYMEIQTRYTPPSSVSSLTGTL